MRLIDADTFKLYLFKNVCLNKCNVDYKKSNTIGCKYCYITSMKKAIDEQPTLEGSESNEYKV